ncbi:flavodoxin family protein [Pseudodesulfovibrio sediminis]|uniref:Flavodoxin family protein n=1 Tax=Pseudodesulfovibrio sediminis TaxID=2810563 RepID=A0ABM7P8G8_9BACT|nr:flavodoxin family protein [Pseudodesulfovibrio sediminis]BCS89280.1 flavodoxin family protein [Pseudodesulfovibrio sediminis]
MNVLAFNGSARRKNWNTVTMLEHALEGARESGAETELINLYQLDFKGCSSCFACKRLDRKKTGVCAFKDDLQPILEKVREAHAIILGTPVYFGSETATTRAFLERLQFPYLNYKDYNNSHFPRHMPTGLMYTMNVTEEQQTVLGYESVFERTRNYLARIFGSCELVIANNTTQYTDYDKFEAAYEKNEKARYREAFFASDCQRAREMGARLVCGESA